MENEELKLLNNDIANISHEKMKIKFNYIFIKYFLIIIIIIIVIILYFHLLNSSKYFLNSQKLIIFTGNYSLYKKFQSPQVTIILPHIEQLRENNDSIINFIDNLRNQSLKNLQILISFSTNEFYNIIEKFSYLDNRIKIFSSINDNHLYDLYDLNKKIKGLFVIIINKIIFLEQNEIEDFFNFTKGKIENIFKFKSNKGNNITLIRSKIIKSLIDEELYFNNITNFINYLDFFSKPVLNYISIVLCPDNYYTAYTYVAMMSILFSKFYSTYISFYLLINDDFEKKNINFLYSLYEQYDFFNITFINIGNKYNDAYISRYLTKQTYFRFSVGELIIILNIFV